MIERKFVEKQKKEFRIQETISDSLNNVGHSHTKLQNTPLGEKIIIHTSRPGLVVGRKGRNIIMLNKILKERFELNNPQIEIVEVEHPDLDPIIVAERISSTLERFGLNRFKGAMHRALSEVLNAGALGAEITVSGKVPSARARTWRVFGGYLKKSGDMAKTVVRQATALAHMRSGVVGVTVKIMPQVKRPDDISFRDEPLSVTEVEEVVKVVEEKPKKKKRSSTISAKKTTTKEKTTKKKQTAITEEKQVEEQETVTKQEDKTQQEQVTETVVPSDDSQKEKISEENTADKNVTEGHEHDKKTNE